MSNGEELDNRGKWYVVQAMSGHENKVKENLLRQLQISKEDLPVYEVLVPVEKVSEVKQGTKITSSRKFFPGYVLIRMDLYKEDGQIVDELWYFVRNVQGIIGFIGCGADNKPQPLSQREVDNLLNQLKEKEEAVVPKMLYDIGEVVVVKEGAFESFEGVIESIDQEKGKLSVSVSIFGRNTPVELEFWQVEKSE